MPAGKDISRRTYLSAFGSVLAGTTTVGSATAYNKYQQWKQTPFSQDMKIIGHRGAAGIAPQNTIEAIRTAAKYGVDGVELDVQQTSDGELIMFHDPIYNIATDNGSGLVSNTPYDEAKQYTIEGEPLITLEEAVQEVKNHNLELFLELKSPNIVQECLDIIEYFNWKHKTTFISLDLPYLDGAHHTIDTALIKKTPHIAGISVAKSNNCTGVATHYSPVNQKDFIKRANKFELQSIIWNLVDTRTSIYDSLKSDADVLIANRPDIIASIYSENGLTKMNQT